MKKEYKPIIGIIAEHIEEDNRPFNCYIKFVNNYTKRVIEVGGIPIGILQLKNKFIENSLELCDGFIFHGGANIETVNLQALDYIIKSGKPCLAICLGIQTLAVYDYLKQNKKKLNYNINDENKFLEKVANHNQVNPFYLDKIKEAKHLVYLNDDSIIKNMLHKDIIKVVSIHNYKIKDNILNNSKYFKVTGYSIGNVIEVIESINNNHFLIGVQFHPELEDKYLVLFKELIKQAKKRNLKI